MNNLLKRINMRLFVSALFTILLLANFTSCETEDDNKDRDHIIKETPPTDDNSTKDTTPKEEDNSSTQNPPKEETTPPKEDTKPPKEETPPPKEDTKPPKDVVNPGPFPPGVHGDITLTPDWTVPKGALFLDVRNDWERVDFRAAGTVGGAVYEYRERGGNGSERYINSDFHANVLALAGSEHRQVILICHSGSRTSSASKLLSDNGFTNVWHIVGGMNSWIQVKPMQTIVNAPL
jgi:rhodanese-related sulfurtransferase